MHVPAQAIEQRWQEGVNEVVCGNAERHNLFKRPVPVWSGVDLGRGDDEELGRREGGRGLSSLLPSSFPWLRRRQDPFLAFMHRRAPFVSPVCSWVEKDSVPPPEEAGWVAYGGYRVLLCTVVC